jgi:hypothetical protein
MTHVTYIWMLMIMSMGIFIECGYESKTRTGGYTLCLLGKGIITIINNDLIQEPKRGCSNTTLFLSISMHLQILLTPKILSDQIWATLTFCVTS